MSIVKNLFKKTINRFGYKLVAQKLLDKMVNTSDRGLLGLDFSYLLPDFADPEKFKCCFDIGANHGQTTDKLLIFFPNAEVYAYEPIAATHRNLLERHAFSARVHVKRAALSDFIDPSFEISLHESDQQNSLLNTAGSGSKERISVTTLDRECARLGLNHIDFLKIDTEGCELQVINGALNMIGNGKVDFIYAEVGFQPDDKEHTFFLDFSSTLYNMGYRMIGLFENIYNGEPLCFHYSNALFMLKRTTPLE
jgi:FkbM family methyltransferase